MTEFPVIIKADGAREAFDPIRLVTSLRRAGAGAHAAEHITEKITDAVLPGMTSKEIYARAFSMLRKEARPVAARYALRRALLELGPSGHPFEDFISHLYEAMGWHIETRKVLMGRCVAHELDMYASHPAENTYLAAELKYHNDASYKTDIKVALYVKSRFDDIFNCDPKVQECPIDRGMLITNTKFTSEAIKYAECAGVELLGWGYPDGNSLFDQMSRTGIYPVTALTTLNRSEKRLLIERGVIAVDQVTKDRRELDLLHLSVERVGEVLSEAEGMLHVEHVPREALAA